MTDEVEGWGLEQALEALRADLTRAGEAGGDGMKFPITSVTVELKVVASRNKTGKAGFKVPFVETQLGGEMGRRDEVTSTVTLVLGSPVDAAGNQVRIGEAADRLKR